MAKEALKKGEMERRRHTDRGIVRLRDRRRDRSMERDLERYQDRNTDTSSQNRHKQRDTDRRRYDRLESSDSDVTEISAEYKSQGGHSMIHYENQHTSFQLKSGNDRTDKNLHYKRAAAEYPGCSTKWNGKRKEVERQRQQKMEDLYYSDESDDDDLEHTSQRTYPRNHYNYQKASFHQESGTSRKRHKRERETPESDATDTSRETLTVESRLPDEDLWDDYRPISADEPRKSETLRSSDENSSEDTDNEVTYHGRVPRPSGFGILKDFFKSMFDIFVALINLIVIFTAFFMWLFKKDSHISGSRMIEGTCRSIVTIFVGLGKMAFNTVIFVEWLCNEDGSSTNRHKIGRPGYSGKWTIIAFDLEGTAQGKTKHIIQISAVELRTNKSFNCYVIPKIPMEIFVEAMTGISVKTAYDGSKYLTVHGEETGAFSISEAIEKFFRWLDRNEFKNVVLVAHGGQGYDFPVFKNACNNIGKFPDLQERVSGFLDSLQLFQRKFPGQPSYKQINLVKAILNETYRAHDALEDSRALAKLLLKSNIQESDITSGMMTVKNGKTKKKQPKCPLEQRLIKRKMQQQKSKKAKLNIHGPINHWGQDTQTLTSPLEPFW